MKLPIFKLEEYFSQWEFKAPYLLCMSDIEGWSLNEILSMADAESLKLWEKLWLGYTETQGLPLLREEISHLYTCINREQVLMFAGAEEGVYASMQALLSANDHVIIFTPCYQSLEALPVSLGANVTAIALDSEKQWKVDFTKIEQAFRPTTRLIIFNFPHNPTGTILDKEIFFSIIKLARKYGTYIFSDEAYRFMEIDEKQRLPAIADCYEKGISLSVMSKAFGLAGLRIGWLATQDQLFLKQVANIKHYLSICNSALSEVLALIALRAKDHILKRNRDIIQMNLSYLKVFFYQHPSILTWNPPAGGCTAFPKLLISQTVNDFTRELIQEEGVLLLPASVYNWPGSYFRLGFGRENMPEALERLERFLINKFYLKKTI